MSAAIPKNRQLPTKEASNFRAALKLYESKQYKKAVKTADGILKKHPDHGETMSVKGLSLCGLNKKEEGFDLIRKGLAKDITSYVCWHILGLYYKNEKNYEEAVKAYTKASSIDPKNIGVLRDLSMLQMQNRQYDNLVETRKNILVDQAGYRMNWTGLAVAQHLAHDYTGAIGTLDNFQKALQEGLPRSDQENSELLMYRNYILYDSGKVDEALADLEDIKDKVCDVLGVEEAKARYLLDIGRTKEAAIQYRSLIRRNPECAFYYQGLEDSMSIAEDDTTLRWVLYSNLIAKHPTAETPKNIALKFLSGESDEFKKLITTYIGNYVKRGVPGAFGLIKQYYEDPSKKSVISDFIENQLNPSTSDSEWFWSQNIKAFHYDHLRQHTKALQFINAALEADKEHKMLELFMTKARILKHSGDFSKAADSMNEARQIDKSDRFFNTKTTKYMLRADRMDEAIDIVSLFTKNDIGGNGVYDLQDMQALWFLIEQAESYARIGNKALALKRLDGIFKIFEEFKTDQYDFHYYACRRGSMRNYLDMLQWADGLYNNETYIRACRLAVDIYTSLFDAELVEKAAGVGAGELVGYEGLDPAERKKAINKAKKLRSKELKKEAEAQEKYTGTDTDIAGRQLLNTKTPLEEAYRYWKPLESAASASPETWEIAFEIYARQKKFVLAIQALSKAKQTGSSPEWLIASAVRARKLLEEDTKAPAALKAVQFATIGNAIPDRSDEVPEEEEVESVEDALDVCGTDTNVFLDNAIWADPDHPTPSEIFEWVRGKIALNDGISNCIAPVEKRLLQLPTLSSTTGDDARKGFLLLKSWSSLQSGEFLKLAETRWPSSTFN